MSKNNYLLHKIKVFSLLGYILIDVPTCIYDFTAVLYLILSDSEQYYQVKDRCQYN